MAALGNIGRSNWLQEAARSTSPFTRTKAPTWVTIVVPDVVLSKLVRLSLNTGQPVDFTKSDSLGNAYFYDLDDGGYIATEIGTGNAWSITVVGAVVTIVRISSTGTPISVYAA